jgi:hypothetical protein
MLVWLKGGRARFGFRPGSGVCAPADIIGPDVGFTVFTHELYSPDNYIHSLTTLTEAHSIRLDVGIIVAEWPIPFATAAATRYRRPLLTYQV